jgi:hypothetical protein
MALEVRHHWKYGHFFPLGMHADVIGDGITTLNAHLTNFGLYPQEVERCEFISGVGSHEVSVAYRVEQLDTETHDWKTLFDNANYFCRPFPPGIAHTKLVTRALWTGQTLSTDADPRLLGLCRKGETMRLVIKANGHDFPTSAFMTLVVYRQ